LRLPGGEPIFLSVGQAVSLVVAAAVLMVLVRRGKTPGPETGTPPRTPAP
jgi:hypothetical protein